ncbi:hypothetical protein E2C01_071919 [Portunus trituberculatus]|uniref:Uncharacterized protein n=1 Tax=Portunus trituberculatus TaxID=210409 RepID=A0A5B7I5R2_PORTR|nr:hypothetical protein [Portunus trituberculatus]
MCSKVQTQAGRRDRAGEKRRGRDGAHCTADSPNRRALPPPNSPPPKFSYTIANPSPEPSVHIELPSILTQTLRPPCVFPTAGKDTTVEADGTEEGKKRKAATFPGPNGRYPPAWSVMPTNRAVLERRAATQTQYTQSPTLPPPRSLLPSSTCLSLSFPRLCLTLNLTD